MAKKLIILITAIIFLSSFAVAEDVAYIVKSSSGVDSFLLNEISSLGYTYDIVYESQVPSTDLSQYLFLIIGNQNLDNPSLIPVEKHKTIFINSYNYYNKFSNPQFGWSVDKSSTTNSILKISNSGHQILNGLPQEFTAYTTSQPIYILKGKKPTGIAIHAYRTFSSDSVVASLNEGQKFLNGKTLEKKSVFFGITEAQYWTANTKKLFANSINWLVGEDLDGDGYFTPEDCDDSDSEINPGAEEILDDINQNCIDDAPFFTGVISDITWDEDSEPEEIDLADYFSDYEGDELIYSIHSSSSNSNIQVFFDGSVVSFESDEDWFGDDWVIFKASDAEGNAVSNKIILKVANQPEPPSFDEIDCLAEIEEDSSYACAISASDIDSSDLEFSAADEDNLKCSLDGLILTYEPEENYNGDASCTLQVSDGELIDTLEFQVEVSPINDAPEVISKNPSASVVNLMQGTAKTFSMDVSDVDSELVIRWILDSAEQDEDSEEFEFSESNVGYYTLQAIISDEEYSESNFWNILVMPISSFTCSQASGFICSENEMCAGEILGVKDSDSCCSTQCIPDFGNAGSCELLDSDLEIEIKHPDTDNTEDKIEIGETIEVEIQVENNNDEEQNFEIEVHLYNLDKAKSVEEVKTDIKVSSRSSRPVKFDLPISDDINTAEDYVLFVKAEDDICNQVYLPIEIYRQEDKVVLSEFDLPSHAVCGETITADVEVENVGADEQDILLSLKNSELDISKSYSLTLEDYEGDNKDSREFTIEIPDDADGTYTFEARASYSLKTETISKEIEIQCIKTSSTEFQLPSQTANTLELNSNVEQAPKEIRQKISPVVLSAILSFELVLFAVFIVFYFVFIKRK